jgi:hypothetical protein
MTIPFIAYDSAAPGNIPAEAQGVFYYADGSFAWSPHRFPEAAARGITVHGDPDIASIIDMEPGCVWPPNNGVLRNFVRERMRVHGDACVYTFRAAVDECMAALDGLKPGARLFLSTLDGSAPTTYNGFTVAAVQYWGGMTAPYDKSVVFDTAWMTRKAGG